MTARSLTVDGKCIALRQPSESDAQTLGQVFAVMDPWKRYGFPAAALAASLKVVEPAAPRFAVTFNGALAGAMLIRNAWLRGPYLQFLGIVPEYQGMGIGAALLDWIEATAITAGERNLWVATSEFNYGARRFYQRHGFQHVATLEDLIATGISEILLRKKLYQEK